MTLTPAWSKTGGEARTEEYRTWRTRCGFGAVGDLDQIEYDAETGEPIVFIELCVADRQSTDCPAGVRPGQPPSPNYLAAVEAKVALERPQGRCLAWLARRCEKPLLLVVYIFGEQLTTGLWVKRQGSDRPWQAMSVIEYERRLRQMIRQRGVAVARDSEPDTLTADDIRW